jgi:hypothetical protein
MWGKLVVTKIRPSVVWAVFYATLDVKRLFFGASGLPQLQRPGTGLSLSGEDSRPGPVCQKRPDAHDQVINKESNASPDRVEGRHSPTLASRRAERQVTHDIEEAE